MARHADPGGVFVDDDHRRVLGHMPVPGDDLKKFWAKFDSVHARLAPDLSSDLDEEEVEEILADLEADGFVKNSDKGWVMTKKGFEALHASPPDEVAAEEEK